MSAIKAWRPKNDTAWVPKCWHYGVHMPDGKVIHFTPDGVIRTSFERFRDGPDGRYKDSKVQKVSWKGQFSANEIARNAMTKYKQELANNGESYHKFTNNCEHFATWCATGTKVSGQIQDIGAAGAIGFGVGFGLNVAGIAPFGLLAIPFGIAATFDSWKPNSNES